MTVTSPRGEATSLDFHTVWKKGEKVVDVGERVLRIAQFSLMGALVLAPNTKALGLRRWMDQASTVRYAIFASYPLRQIKEAYDGEDGSKLWCAHSIAVLLLFLDDCTPFKLGEQRTWVNGLFKATWLAGSATDFLYRVREVQTSPKDSLADGKLADKACGLLYCLAMLFATEGKFQAVAGSAAGVVGLVGHFAWPEKGKGK